MLTPNNALKAYFENLKDKKELKINKLMALRDTEKLFVWNTNESKWVQNANGNLRVCFQIKENDYQARTFEDAFFAINKSFLEENKSNLFGLNANHLTKFLNKTSGFDAYKLAENGVESKATFAVEIIFNSKQEDNKDFCGWNIPQYIKEGLLWIRK